MKKSPSKGKSGKAKEQQTRKLKAVSGKSASKPSGSKASGKKTASKPKPLAKPVPAKKGPKAASARPALASRKATKSTRSTSRGATPKPAARATKSAGGSSPKAPARKSLTTLSKATTRAKQKPVKPAPSTGKVATVKLKSKSGAKVSVPLVISTPPQPPEPPRRQVSTGALRHFEQAVKVFNRRYFEDALEMFENVLAKFPHDVEVVARTQMYVQVCKQKIEQTPATPRNAEELYDRGVFALNIGDFSQARQFFEKALRLRPDEPYLLYSLAATHAQAGALEQALDYLRQSFQLQPRLRSQAYNDADFSGLRENKRFLELLGLTSPFDLLESKR